MIVALGFGNTEGDTPSVMVVDTVKMTEAWRNAVMDEMNGKKYTMKARVDLPAKVESAFFLYYRG